MKQTEAETVEDTMDTADMKEERRDREGSDRFCCYDVSQPVIGPVTAEVIHVEMQTVFLSFSHEDQEQVAVMTPGRMFINGSENLLTFAKVDCILRAVLPVKEKFFISVKKLKEPFTAAVASREDGGEKKKDKQEPKVTKTVGWGVALLYCGAPPPVEKLQCDNHRFEKHEAGWQKTAQRVCTDLLTGDAKDSGEDNGVNKEDETWFLASMSGVNPSNIPLQYPEPVKKKVKGTIKEIKRPFGGVVDVGAKNGGQIIFHRNVVFSDGARLRNTAILENTLKVGQKVLVDIVNNGEDDDTELLLFVSSDKVASAVYVGEAVEEEKHPEAESYGQPCHRVRVVELYEGEGGMVTRGLGCIQYSQFIKSGAASTSMVGEFVTFRREDLHLGGVRLGPRVDLAHVLGLGDELRCHLTMLDTKQGRAQFVCKLGWLKEPFTSSSPAVRSHLAAECGAVHRWAAKKGLDWAAVERIVTGEAGVKSQLAGPGDTADMAVGCVVDLEPAENNETVARGLIRIEAGPHKDKVVRFSRTKASLFGLKLDSADLLYVVRPYDRVYCEVAGIGDYPQGQYMSQKVQFHQLCGDREVTDPLQLGAEEQLQLVLWMALHHNTWPVLQAVLAGAAPTRYFIPFPRDQHLGRVVAFDPPKGGRYNMGCTSGTILLDQGSFNLPLDEVEEGKLGVKDMKEVKITFHRSCFWIYGRKMAKADLSYVVQPNQKVVVECKKITEEDRAHHTNLPSDIDYRATIIWIGPSRPRNDRDDPNRSDPGIFTWLSKRGMNIGQFTKLVEGRVPAHTTMDLDHQGFFLAGARGQGAGLASMEMMTRGMNLETMPVLRHGPVLAHILDAAITCNGPSDPRLFTLLENDEMAQAAHHVSEALRYAIQYYKEATAGMRTGFGMGYGPSGPPTGAKRPYDYNQFGGGYSRPPKHPKY